MEKPGELWWYANNFWLKTWRPSEKAMTDSDSPSASRYCGKQHLLPLVPIRASSTGSIISTECFTAWEAFHNLTLGFRHWVLGKSMQFPPHLCSSWTELYGLMITSQLSNANKENFKLSYFAFLMNWALFWLLNQAEFLWNLSWIDLDSVANNKASYTNTTLPTPPPLSQPPQKSLFIWEGKWSFESTEFLQLYFTM